MANQLRFISKRIWVYSNVAVVLLFLMACLAPYLNPQRWGFFYFLGLGFPFLLLIVVLFGVSWLALLRPRLALISGIALLFGIKSISVFFAFHNPGTFQKNKEPGTLRVLSWNVARFVELKRNNNAGSGVRMKMFDLIRQQDADILCFQEFHTSTDSSFYDNITDIRNQLNYPYYYFSFDNDGDKHYYSSVIFSRFPIVDTGKFRYPRPTLPDVLLHADIKLSNDTVRVFTTHLQSLQFRAKDYEQIDKIKNAKDSLLFNSRNILSKLKRGVAYRSIQVGLAHKLIKDSPHPVLFCGDLNDVPNSYTYFKMRGSMQDAFLKKGFGIGRTFTGLSPTLRIDYIFADRNFKIRQFNRVEKKFSDHYMLVCDVALK